jgi:hypothetical protein
LSGAATRRLPAAALVVAVALLAPGARAGDELAEARADYDAAAAAYDRAEYAIAAVRFARADERAPNPRALRLAMASALQISDPALAMNLVERSELRAQTSPLEPAVVELARKLRARFETSAARLEPTCAPEPTCRPRIDGTPVDPPRGRWVLPGKHVVAFETGAAPITREVVLRAGERLDVPMGVASEPPAPPAPVAPAGPAPEAPAPPSAGGLHPAFFWTGVAVTGVAVAAASVLTVVVGNRHDDFLAQPSRATADAGDAAQTRARVVWAIAGVSAAATVVLAVFTDFAPHAARASAPAPRYTFVAGPSGAGVTGTFW